MPLWENPVKGRKYFPYNKEKRLTVCSCLNSVYIITTLVLRRTVLFFFFVIPPRRPSKFLFKLFVHTCYSWHSVVFKNQQHLFLLLLIFLRVFLLAFLTCTFVSLLKACCFVIYKTVWWFEFVGKGKWDLGFLSRRLCMLLFLLFWFWIASMCLKRTLKLCYKMKVRVKNNHGFLYSTFYCHFST